VPIGTRWAAGFAQGRSRPGRNSSADLAVGVSRTPVTGGRRTAGCRADHAGPAREAVHQERLGGGSRALRGTSPYSELEGGGQEEARISSAVKLSSRRQAVTGRPAVVDVNRARSPGPRHTGANSGGPSPSLRPSISNAVSLDCRRPAAAPRARRAQHVVEPRPAGQAAEGLRGSACPRDGDPSPARRRAADRPRGPARSRSGHRDFRPGAPPASSSAVGATMQAGRGAARGSPPGTGLGEAQCCTRTRASRHFVVGSSAGLGSHSGLRRHSAVEQRKFAPVGERYPHGSRPARRSRRAQGVGGTGPHHPFICGRNATCHKPTLRLQVFHQIGGPQLGQRATRGPPRAAQSQSMTAT